MKRGVGDVNRERISYHNTVEWRSFAKLSQIMFLQEGQILQHLEAVEVEEAVEEAVEAEEEVAVEADARK